MIYAEYKEQVAFVQWCKLATRYYPQLELLYCNHNTQKLTKVQAARWKMAGGRSGVPDTFLAAANNKYHGLYIEFKAPDLKPKTAKSKGGLSDVQLELFPKLEAQGYKVEVCYSWLDAKTVVEEYLGVIR